MSSLYNGAAGTHSSPWCSAISLQRSYRISPVSKHKYFFTFNTNPGQELPMEQMNLSGPGIDPTHLERLANMKEEVGVEVKPPWDTADSKPPWEKRLLSPGSPPPHQVSPPPSSSFPPPPLLYLLLSFSSSPPPAPPPAPPAAVAAARGL